MNPGHSPDVPGVVVVTGVSRYLGAHVAARLAAEPRVGRVVGLDPHDPSPELASLLTGIERIRADAGSAGTVIADLGAEAVVHLALVTAPEKQHGGRAAMKEQNVIGTMQLLAACQRAPGSASWSSGRPPRRTVPRSATRRSSPRKPSRGRSPAAGSPGTSSTSRGTSAASAAAGRTSPPRYCGSRRSSGRPPTPR
ncbi:hypothetical protein GCM10027605_07370 [Micromonospora zhanjiangensis]